MKKLRLLSLLTIPVITVPFLTMMTSCNSLATIYVKEFSINSFNGNNDIVYKDAPYSGYDLKTLVYGDTDFHKGNYIVFIANSQASNFLSWLFSTAQSYSSNTNVDGSQQGDPATIKNSGYFYESLTEINERCINTKTDFGCTFMLEQDFPTQWGQNNPDPSYAITSPFTKFGDNWNDNNINKDDYRRNDTAAVTFRYLVNTLSSLFANNASVSGLNASGGAMVGLVYKDGKPLVDKFLTSDNSWVSDALYLKWKDIYTS